MRTDLIDPLLEIIIEYQNHEFEQMTLRREILKKRTLGDIRLLAQLIDRKTIVPVIRQQRDRLPVNALFFIGRKAAESVGDDFSV